jgi:hypothetical protein
MYQHSQKKGPNFLGGLLLAELKEMDKLTTTQVEWILEQPDIIASEAS